MNRIGVGRSWIFGALLALAVLAGCSSKDNPASTGPPTGTTADLARLVESAIIPGAVLPTNIDTTASIVFSLNVDGLRAASALFVGGTPRGLVSAGTVTVGPIPPGPGTVALNTYELIVQGFLQTVYTTLVSHPVGINLPFDGATYHRFTTSGTSLFPAMSDSVLSVGLPVISAPAAGANVLLSADLVVNWSNPGTDTTTYVLVMVVSLVDTTKVAIGMLVTDPGGVAVVNTPELGLLPAGPARMSVARFRIAPRSVSGHATALICEAASTRAITLVVSQARSAN